MTNRRDFLLAASVAAAPAGCRDRGHGRRRAALWFTYGGKNREVVQSLVRRFNESQREHYIDAVYQGDYYEGLAKLRTAVFAGTAPALSHVIGEVIPYLEHAGVLEPMAGYPGARGMDVVPELGQERSWVGGGQRPLVALPFNRSTPIAYLNGALFAKAGLTAPRSWQELRAHAKRLTRGRQQHGFGCPISWWFWVALTGQAGGQVIEPDGTVSLGGAAGERAVELWQTLVRDGSMKPPPGRDYNAWEQTNQDFLAGRTAMIWTSTAFLKYLEENASFPVVAAPLPGAERRAVPTGGTHWVLLRSAPAAEKRTAWAFLRFMHRAEQVIEWSTRTGYMPVTREAIATLERRGYYAEHPNDRVALDQLSVALPWPWDVDLFRIQREIVQPRLESVVLLDRDPKAVFAEARRLARSGR